jgi:hypothetical protein
MMTSTGLEYAPSTVGHMAGTIHSIARGHDLGRSAYRPRLPRYSSRLLIAHSATAISVSAKAANFICNR